MKNINGLSKLQILSAGSELRPVLWQELVLCPKGGDELLCLHAAPAVVMK
jgi:hypothetical protein